RALEARSRYQPGSNARAWLMRILHNVAVSEHRRTARDLRLRGRFAVEPRLLPAIAEEAPRIALGPAFARLRPADQRVLELAGLEGLRYREVASALKWPIGTVMSRLHRARRRLRQSLGQTETHRAGCESAATRSAA